MDLSNTDNSMDIYKDLANIVTEDNNINSDNFFFLNRTKDKVHNDRNKILMKRMAEMKTNFLNLNYKKTVLYDYYSNLINLDKSRQIEYFGIQEERLLCENNLNLYRVDLNDNFYKFGKEERYFF